MLKLIKRLLEFNIKQQRKFDEVKDKHKDADATDDKTNWKTQWSFTEIENHLFDEIEEYKVANTPFKTKNELIDIANMAFLLWANLQYDD